MAAAPGDQLCTPAGGPSTEVTVTVSTVNTNLEQVAGATKAAANVVKSVEHVSKVVDQAVSSPLIKIAAAGYGFSRASKKVRK